MKKLFAAFATLFIALLITYWQVRAGYARCGAIDGGVLVLPLVAGLVYLVRGVAQDLKEVYSREQKRYYH